MTNRHNDSIGTGILELHQGLVARLFDRPISVRKTVRVRVWLKSGDINASSRIAKKRT